MFGDIEEKKKIRDPYLQRIFKTELEEESCIKFQSKHPKCMLAGLAYPVLIASHIKPYSHCKDGDPAQFDVNNGLLLSKNLDSLFDLGYMTFNNNGTIVASNDLDKDVSNYISKYKLRDEFINPQRIEYLEYHRKMVFKKRYSTASVKKYVFQEPEYLMAAEENT